MKNFDDQDKFCKKEREAREIKFRENTFYYIEKYLNPNWQWNKETSAKERIALIRHADVNWEAISTHIKGMGYRNFLATPYWKTIAAHTRYRAGYRCHLCTNGAGLAVHHRSYHIHGQEHVHMNELIVLCNRCHQKFHGSEEKIDPSRSENTTHKDHADLFGLIVLLVACFACLFIYWSQGSHLAPKVSLQKLEHRKGKRW